MNTAAPPLFAQGLSKSYGQHLALEDLELRVERGEVVGFLGPNGAGKTTTLRLCLDLLRPSAGQVRLFGEPPVSAAARARVGYLPGELQLDERLSAEKQLKLLDDLRPKGVAPSDPARRDELCERLGLRAADRSRRLGELSRGNKQKVGLVAAFQHDPELLILDEPSTALDPLVRESLFELIVETSERGHSVLHSSHVLSEVDRSSARLVVLRAGRQLPIANVSELRASLPRALSTRFPGAVPREELLAAGAEALVIDGQDARMQLRGDVSEILAVLHRHRVAELVFPEADLDEAFSRLYERGELP